MARVNIKQIAEVLKGGGFGIFPTDTMYGIICSAFNPAAVEKIYKIRERDRKKPFIILISSISDLKILGVSVSPKQQTLLKKLWPGPISIVLPCRNKKFEYLHRGTKTLAIRFPKNPRLIRLIKLTGPLVAPSANTQDQPPSTTINEAKRYFGKLPNFYVNGGKMPAVPSTIIKLAGNKVELLRQGKAKVILPKN